MTEPKPNNNEFKAAEEALRSVGSNLWFGGLSHVWQEFLVSNTVECFDTYQLTLREAASEIIGNYQKMVTANPSILQSDPRKTNIKIVKCTNPSFGPQSSRPITR
ncbi:MAG: hypothetical protein AAF623_02315 [Planctomycetota bacterium]